MVIDDAGLWLGGTFQTTAEHDDTSTGVVKFDPDSGELVSELDLEDFGAVELELAFGHLWVSESNLAALIKVDPETNEEIARAEAGGPGGSPLRILVTRDLIWVYNDPDSRARGYDPETVEFEIGFDVPEYGGLFVFAP